MFKRTLFVATVLSLIAGPVLASSCPKHMKAIDEALAKEPTLTAAEASEVKELRADGERLHQEGKHAESMAALEQAETILGVK